MNDETRMLALASELVKVKSEQNILAALSIYHPDAVLESPSFGAVARGSEEIELQLNIFFSLFPDYAVELEQYAIRGNVMLSTGKVSVTLNIPDKSCPRIELPVFVEFQFQDNRIIKEVFFLDAGMVCRKSGVTPEELADATRSYEIWKKQIVNT